MIRGRQWSQIVMFALAIAVTHFSVRFLELPMGLWCSTGGVVTDKAVIAAGREGGKEEEKKINRNY